jgi:hypothetical protein
MLYVCCLFCVSLFKIQSAMSHGCGLFCVYLNSKYCRSVCQRVNKPKTALSMPSSAQRICSKTPPKSGIRIRHEDLTTLSGLNINIVSVFSHIFLLSSKFLNSPIMRFCSKAIHNGVMRLLCCSVDFWSGGHHVRSCLRYSCELEDYVYKTDGCIFWAQIESQTCHVFCLLVSPKSFEYAMMTLSRFAWSQCNSVHKMCMSVCTHGHKY